MATWTCPYCQQNATLTGRNISVGLHEYDKGNAYGTQFINSVVEVCPNEDCRRRVIKINLCKGVKYTDSNTHYAGDVIHSWQLIPSSSAKVFPDYIPSQIIDDYEESCLIRDLSPKASATLSRRCIQGIIRDFYGISRDRLVDEINAIRDLIDPQTWSAVDALRKIGNVGAHMEKDINVIVDVDPEEAGVLITLIEIMLKDTYVLRHERQAQLDAVLKVYADKEAAKAAGPPAPTATSTT